MTPFLILGVCICVIYYLTHEHSHFFISSMCLGGGLLYLYTMYSDVSMKSFDIFPSKKPTSVQPVHTMVSNDQRHTLPTDPLAPLQRFLKRLHPYRKYNRVSYELGCDYMRQFSAYIIQLQDLPDHPRHIYENAESSYRAGLNEFQSLSLSIPSHTKTHQLSKSSRVKDHSHKIGTICKEMRTYCHHLLHTFSTDINKDTYASPNIYKSEILQHDIVGYNILHPHELY
jgi:hypothetical protein